MNIIPALEMKGWRPSEVNCTDNQIVVKYEFHAKAAMWRVGGIFPNGVVSFVAGGVVDETLL